MPENSELRRMAREMLTGNWGNALLVCFLYGIILSFANSISMVALIIGGPLVLGLVIYFLNLVRRQEAKIEDMFQGFNDFGRSLIVFLLQGIFVFLWTLLFIIPGIIATLRLSLAFYILQDNPEMTATDALERSRILMHGYKGRLFMLHLSFIGWGILSMLSCGIGFLWLIPYIQASMACFYEERIKLG